MAPGPGMRVTRDTLGEVEVPADKHYGAQTQRALVNFDICASTDKMPLKVVKALTILKMCASEVNDEDSKISTEYADAIKEACIDILDGKYDDNFPLVVWQTGSGTQTNMNVNEVIASVSNVILGGRIGDVMPVHPNDHVNCSQSSNDIFPSAMNVSIVLTLIEHYIPAILHLRRVLENAQANYSKIVKMGRTHMQDAVPMTVGQELSSFVSQISINLHALDNMLPQLCELAVGGTAVGTGLNAVKGFDKRFCEKLNKYIKKRWEAPQSNERLRHLICPEWKLMRQKYTNGTVSFFPALNKFSALSAHDSLCNLSGLINTMATALFKLGNDIRLLSSGPRCGLSEYILPSNEPGSSIMPGKVNPTQCEALTMVCSQVFGNHAAVTFGASQGHLQLNVYKPLIVRNIIHSAELLADAAISFADNCIADLSINERKITEYINNSLMMVTALSPVLGYDAAARIARYAEQNGLSLREAVKQLDAISLEQYDVLVDPKKLTCSN